MQPCCVGGAMVMQSVPCAHRECAVNHRYITLNALNLLHVHIGKTRLEGSVSRHLAIGFSF